MTSEQPPETGQHEAIQSYGDKLYRQVPPGYKDNFHIYHRHYRECFTDEGKNLIYIYILKNASSSTRKYLPCKPNGHPIHADYERRFDAPQFHKMCIWRNPADRLVSSYMELRKLRHDFPSDRTLELGYLSYSSVEESFERFLDSIDDNLYDPHLFPQVVSLYDKGLVVEDVDLLLFDTLGPDLKRYNREHTLGWDLSQAFHANAAPSEDKNRLKNLLRTTSHLSQQVRDLYPEDTEIYNRLKKEKLG
tara:strand:+ start:1095 stop:1838 length:744 start_codon:yes stop_codon:yes gene_type:complete